MAQSAFSDKHALSDVAAVEQVVDHNAEIIVVSLKKVEVDFKISETILENKNEVVGILFLI